VGVVTPARRRELMEGAAAPDARRAALAVVHFPEQRTLAADEPCAADDLPPPGACGAGGAGQGADPVDPGTHRTGAAGAQQRWRHPRRQQQRWRQRCRRHQWWTAWPRV